ncbi:carbohydrate kinase family protein [Rhodovibrio salinarum]|uniref:carbohydrate kinase family protein n=1 Tax=Rhodovibrio salinarum TaxID=1087 RepID=UPI0004B73D77|nr:PfkB family carbohydrate kinase [Rhodovibrio salinarum]
MARKTIRDVAQHARVSVGTVSNVLNGHGRVGPETRRRVEEAIAELGYRPDTIAQSLIARRRASSARTLPPNAPRLSSVGYLSVDFITRIDVLPHRDDRITAESINRALGGPAANVATYAASLHDRYPVHSELITALGFDADSEWAVSELYARGVNTIGIDRRAGQRLSRAIVMVEPNGSRTIINEPLELGRVNVARHLGRTESPQQADQRHAVHVEGYQVDSLADELKQVHDLGVTTSMHAAGLPSHWANADGFRRLTEIFGLLFINRELATRIVGMPGRPRDEIVAAMHDLLTHSPATQTSCQLILTLDQEGASYLRADGSGVQMAAPPTQVVDLTGAGDTLAGVFLAVWLNGEGPAVALQNAVAAASEAIRHQGAQGLDLDAATLATLTAATEAPVAFGGRAASKNAQAEA